jgi:hypothetical protein
MRVHRFGSIADQEVNLLNMFLPFQKRIDNGSVWSGNGVVDLTEIVPNASIPNRFSCISVVRSVEAASYIHTQNSSVQNRSSITIRYSDYIPDFRIGIGDSLCLGG